MIGLCGPRTWYNFNAHRPVQHILHALSFRIEDNILRTMEKLPRNITPIGLFYRITFMLTITILLTKTTAAQNEVTLNYRRVRGLYFLAVVFAATIRTLHIL